MPLAALAGALVGGAALYALAWRGGVQGYRLVLVGIGLAAFAQAGRLATCSPQGRIFEVAQAYVWLVGSLNGARLGARCGRSPRRSPSCSPLLLGLGRRLDALAARRRPRARASARRRALAARRCWRPRSCSPASRSSAAGPIGFVAFLAPQIARRLTRRASQSQLPLAAGCGAVLVLVADLVGRLLFAPTEIPVGLVTVDHRRAVLPCAAAAASPRLGLTVAYGDAPVVRELDLEIPRGRITAIVGANGCGKSTLLRALARLIAPRAGAVLLDGTAIAELGLARRRAPARDPAAVAGRARRADGRGPRRARPLSAPGPVPPVVGERRGGGRGGARRHRRRPRCASGRSTSSPAASASARGSRWRSRSRPSCCCSTSRRRSSTSRTRSTCSTCSTTSSRERGRTVVMVLHDLNQACRYADHLVALRDGRVHAAGAPGEIVDDAFVRDVFGLDARVVEDPVTGTPLCLPIARTRRTRCAHLSRLAARPARPRRSPRAATTTTQLAQRGEARRGVPGDVQHKFGTTEVKEAPKRVVTVGYTDQDAVLALGVVPVGVGDFLGGYDWRKRPWAQAALKGSLAEGRQRAADQLRGRRRPAAGPDHRHQRRAEEGRLREAHADRADRRAVRRLHRLRHAVGGADAARRPRARPRGGGREGRRARAARSSSASARSTPSSRARPRSSPTAGPTATAPTRRRTRAAASSPTSASRRPRRSTSSPAESFFVAVQPGAVPAHGPGRGA